MYLVYCYDSSGANFPTGAYTEPEGATQRVIDTMPRFPRVIATDDGDNIIMEAIDGKIVFPQSVIQKCTVDHRPAAGDCITM